LIARFHLAANTHTIFLFMFLIFGGKQMSTTLTQTLPITPLATIRPDLAVVCLFSLLGLMLSAVVVSCVSSETVSMMFSPLG